MKKSHILAKKITKSKSPADALRILAKAKKRK